MRGDRQDLGDKNTTYTVFLPSYQCNSYSIHPKSDNKVFDLDKN